ncbi:MAG: DUF3267 domain-containing protein [Anaerovorax sp.]|nr:DUF3267 domain-containing protein [Anaerovorax sp.]
MKYIKKLPATDNELSSQLQKDGWIKIKEPKNVVLAILFSFPFMFILSIVIVWLAYLLRPEIFNFITSNSFSLTIQLNIRFLFFIIIIVTYMFLHEMIHAALIPNFIKSEKTFWGINGLFAFVFTTEPITKRRFLIVSCMPFVLLSIGSMLFFDLIDYLNEYTFLLCLINAAGSCVDFLNMILIGFQVKPGHTIINNGFETYYSPTKLT